MLTATRSPYSATQPETNRLRQQNHILQAEVTNLRRAFNALYNIQQVMDDIRGPEDVEVDGMALVDTILEAALASIEAKDGSLLLVDDDADELAFVVVHGDARERLQGHRIPISTGIAGWVARNQEAVLVPNVNLDPRFSQSVDRDFRFKTTSLLCAPVSRHGRLLGVIQGLNKENSKTFSEADLTLLSVVARQAAEAIHLVNTMDEK